MENEKLIKRQLAKMLMPRWFGENQWSTQQKRMFAFILLSASLRQGKISQAEISRKTTDQLMDQIGNILRMHYPLDYRKVVQLKLPEQKH